MSRRTPRPALVLLATGLTLAAGYVLLEVGVQTVARVGWVGEFSDLRYFEEKLLEPLGRGESPGQADIDDALGWVQDVVVYPADEADEADERVERTGGAGAPSDSADAASPKTVLFLGDSVTFGEIATRGQDDYVTRVSRALTPRGIRVVNAAATGYGVDQMMLRLPRDVAAWSPDLIVVAYIPHDLRRIGQSRFIRMPKPMLELAGPGLRVRAPEDIRAFYAGQADAIGEFRYGPWLMSERWAQRRYGMPGLHLEWYEAVLDRLVARIAREARYAGAALVFVEIPNFADETSTRLLAPIMRRVLEAGAEAGGYAFVMLEPCLRERAAPAPWPTDEFAAQHPGRAGHADLAACMLQALSSVSEAVRHVGSVQPASS